MATQPPALTREQALDARPVAARIVRRSPLPDGGQRVAVPLQPTRWQKLFLRIPDDATRDFDLDTVGVEILDLCTGENSVRHISKLFAKNHKVNQHEAQQAVVTFVQTLLSRGLIVILVKK